LENCSKNILAVLQRANYTKNHEKKYGKVVQPNASLRELTSPLLALYRVIR